MTRTALLLAACTALTAPLGAQSPSVTLFNSGTVMVRRTLPATIPSGVTTLPLALGVFSPSSLAMLDPGVSLVRIAFDPAWSEDALLRRHLGERFTFRTGMAGNPTTTATLVALDPERWRLDSTGMSPTPTPAAGRVVFGRPGQILWPTDQVPAAPVADVTVQSDKARNGLKVMYEVGGGSWAASYRIFLGAEGRIEGMAMLNAGTLTLPDAEVQLLAGDIGVSRVMPSSPRSREMYAMAAAKVADNSLSQEAVGEAHLYTVPGKVTFVPGTQLVMPLFEPMPVKGTRLLTVAGGLPYYGSFVQEQDESDVPVGVAYRFDRKLGTPFGDLPLPAGAVNIYDNDKGGRPQLIGAGAIDHTAPGELLVVNTGTAFDVSAKRTQTAFNLTREQPTQPNQSTRTIVMVSYRVSLQNAKDSAAVVEVREDRGGEWSVVSSSVPPVKRSSSRTVFLVTVPAKGKVDLTYRLRVVW